MTQSPNLDRLIFSIASSWVKVEKTSPTTYNVKVGYDEQIVFSGSKDKCEHVALKMAEAFREGTAVMHDLLRNAYLFSPYFYVRTESLGPLTPGRPVRAINEHS